MISKPGMEHIPSFDVVPEDELSDLLLNLSNTYFTDINIYNSNGFLLSIIPGSDIQGRNDFGTDKSSQCTAIDG